MSNTHKQIDKIVGKLINAIKIKDLSALYEVCAERQQVVDWLNSNGIPIDQKMINAIGKGVNKSRRNLESAQILIANQTDLNYLFWSAWQRSDTPVVVNETWVMFTNGAASIVIEFATIELGNQNFLFQDFAVHHITPALERYFDQSSNEFDRFQTDVLWPDNLAKILSEEGGEEFIQHYQRTCAKYACSSYEPGVNIEVCVGSDEAVEEIENLIDRKIPNGLATWWKSVSVTFVGDDWSTWFCVITPEQIQDMVKNQDLEHSVKSMGLAEVLDYYHSGEFKEILSNEEYETLNKNYMIVGFYRIGDADALYIYADQDGQFGVLEYNHEWRNYRGINWDAEFRALLHTSRAESSLSELVAEFFTLSAYQLWNGC